MRAWWAVVAGVVALGAGGCTPAFIEEGQAPVLLQVVSITGQSGQGAGSGVGSVLNSDVSPIFNDNATITVRAVSKNANSPSLGSFNDVYLNQYSVRYFRTDGRNQEGEDVPFAISGPMALLVPAGGEGAAPIVIVRHQAKLEPPLKNLNNPTVLNPLGGAFGGGDVVLTVIAEVTVYGRTTAGKTLQAIGRLQINFADFADSTS